MADARVTQQYVEVLGPAAGGAIRVTQQYLEYLREYNDGFIESELPLSQTILANMIRSRSLTQGLFFGEDIG
ncbi:hypothetical protein LCGC14_2174210, partial [marine sediment metagenome]